MNPVLARQKLNQKNLKVFTPCEFKSLFDLTDSAAQKIIHNYTQKNLLEKLRNGLYVLKEDNYSIFQIANKIYQPSYISLEAALSFYNIIPETVYSITSVTTKATREFDALNQIFSYSKIKKNSFCGYHLNKKNNDSFLIAEPEKALADYLYFVALNKKTLNDRLDLKKLNKRKIKEWGKVFNLNQLDLLIKQICSPKLK